MDECKIGCYILVYILQNIYVWKQFDHINVTVYSAYDPPEYILVLLNHTTISLRYYIFIAIVI